MHEFSIIKDLIRKISTIAHEQHARKVLGVTIKLGVLSCISPDHFREHFALAACGTVAEGAQLTIIIITDPTDPQSQAVLLESIEV